MFLKVDKRGFDAVTTHKNSILNLYNQFLFCNMFLPLYDICIPDNNYQILTNNYIRPRTHEYKQIEYEQQGSAKRDLQSETHCKLRSSAAVGK